MQYDPFDAQATQPNEVWGAPRYAAYILHAQGQPQWVDLGEAAAINEAVTAFRQQFSPDSFEIKKTARRLDQLLMEPVRQKLGSARQILLSPDSTLNLIPFAALVDKNGQFLVENYTITYLTSGRDLLRLANPTASRQSPVIVANPTYDRPGDAKEIASASRRAHQQRSGDITKLTFDPLPGTAAEGNALVALLPETRLLTKTEATENALKQLQGPAILHVATHGFFLEIQPEQRSSIDEVTPFKSFQLQGGSISNQPFPLVNTENPLLRSGLALAGFNPRQSGQEDGVLTALEAAGLDLRGTKLVVLSACETGVGEVANGEGVYGLRRAFAIAGAESQLLSLWTVSDEATKDLMVGYYKRLLEQEGRSEALRQTQLAMLRGQQYQHPYYWAAFIPSGAWTPIDP